MSKELDSSQAKQSGWPEHRVVMHVDMDAFFAAVEQRNNPSLRGKPVIVGGSAEGRGVVSTASYEARKFGVHSAMPAREAVRLCPDGIFLRGDFKSYHDASVKVKETLGSLSPNVEMISIDEAFIEATGTERIYDSPAALAQKIKEAVAENVGISCSIGVSMNKLIAKLGSALNKPEGLTIIWPQDLKPTVYPLSVDHLWGVGPVTYRHLLRHGVKTIGDLATLPESNVKHILGEYGQTLAKRARGEDERDVLLLDDDHLEKSISHETTLAQDAYDPAFAEHLLAYLSEKVLIRLYRGGWEARTIGIKVRYKNFKTITRDRTLPRPTCDFGCILDTARSLLPADEIRRRGLRLIGVRTSNLVQTEDRRQLELFASESARQEQLNRTVADLRERFGDDVISHASALRQRKDD